MQAKMWGAYEVTDEEASELESKQTLLKIKLTRVCGPPAASRKQSPRWPPLPACTPLHPPTPHRKDMAKPRRHLLGGRLAHSPDCRIFSTNVLGLFLEDPLRTAR